MDKIPTESFIRLKLVHPMLHIPAKSSVYYPSLMDEPYENKSDNHVNIVPFTSSHFIRWFSYLPDLVLKQILNEAEMILDISNIDEQTGFGQMFWSYRTSFLAIQYWLLRKHENIIHENLYDEPFIHFEPIAEASLELLKLIQKMFDMHYAEDFKNIVQKLYTTTEDNNFHVGCEPLIWFSCEFCSLKQAFETNGMFGKAILKSRKTIDEHIKKYDRTLENHHVKKLGNIPTGTIPNVKNTYEDGYVVISSLAEELSRVNEDFHNDVFEPYCRIRKHTLRELRNSKLPLAYLNEYGEFIQQTHGKGRGRSKKRKA
jgi:hypothetical protein